MPCVRNDVVYVAQKSLVFAHLVQTYIRNLYVTFIGLIDRQELISYGQMSWPLLLLLRSAR